MINVGGDASDRSYRYKMPALVTKIEGRGNGIKTVVVNMADVAKALRCNPAYTTKYFGIELGAQTKWTEEKERAVVNGAHQTNDMQAILTRFIAKFILCAGCGLPEIKREVKRGTIRTDCAACGAANEIGGNHKLIGYIVKNAGDTSKKKKKKEKKEKKEDKKKKDKKKKAKRKERSDDENSGDEKGEPGAEKEEPDAPNSSKSSEPTWYADTSAEAQEARKHAEMNTMKRVNREVDAILASARLENAERSPTTLFKVFMASAPEGTVRSVAEIQSEAQRLQIAHSLDETKLIKTLIEALIDTSDLKAVPAQFTKHAGILALYTSRGASQLLQCLEEFVGVIEPGLLQRIPIILKNLFDAEVLTDEAIISWYEMPPENSWLVNKTVSAKVRQHAAPLVSWLQEVDEDDEEEDEEEE